MEVNILKEELSKKLAELGPQFDGQDRMEIAIKLKISTKTIGEYFKGNFNRNLELAEKIVISCNEILASKATAEKVSA